MKNSILILFYLTSFFCNNTFAQNSHQIKSANLNLILNSIHSEIIEKGFDLKDVLHYRDSLGQKMINQFQLNYQYVSNKINTEDFTKKHLLDIENKLLNIQNQIQFFEKETNKILRQSQMERNQNVLLYTETQIKDFGSKNQTLIMSTEVILFQNDKAGDITSTLLKHIHQSEGYNDWVNSFDNTAHLINEIKKLDFQIEPIFK